MVIDAALMAACAPNVPTPISYAIAKTESNFNPYAIGVNKGAKGLARQPRSYQEAVQAAYRLRAEGKNFDVGLAQINITNFGWLGLSIEKAFNPCENLKAMQKVYLNCLSRFGNGSGQGTPIQRAFSCYNTGNASRGFRNGYVTKVTNHYNAVIQAAGKVPSYAAQPASITVSTPKSVPAAGVLSAANISASQTTAPTPTAVTTPNGNTDLVAADSSPRAIEAKQAAAWDVFFDFVD